MRSSIVSLFVVLFFNASYSQNICNQCINVKIEGEKNQVELSNYQFYYINFIIENCSKTNLKIPFPKIGFEDDNVNFANIIFYVYDKNNNSQRVYFDVGDVGYTYEIDTMTINIPVDGKYKREINFPALCPIRKTGNYSIMGILRLKTDYGFLSFYTNKIELRAD